MRELLKCFLTGVLAIGGVSAFVWGWINLFLPLWYTSLTLRYAIVGFIAVLLTTWVGAMIQYSCADATASSEPAFEDECFGDGVVGE